MMLKLCYYFRHNGARLATSDHESQDAPLVVPASGMALFINPNLTGKTLPHVPEGGGGKSIVV